MIKIIGIMGERGYWIGIIDKENYDILRRIKTFGIKKIFQKKVRELKEKDLILFYILGKRISGIFEIISKPYLEETHIFSKSIYPIRFKIRETGVIRKKIFKDELIKELSFINNKKMWGGHFQGKSIIRINKEDFNKIKKYLENEK